MDKIAIGCVLLVVAMLLGCKPNSNPSTTQAEDYTFTTDSLAILNVLSTQQSAWNEGDIPKFMEGYWKDEDLTFIGVNGVTYGWQNTLDNYIKGYPDAATMG